MATVDVEKQGNRIHAKIPYDNGAGPREAKAVPGARWSKTAKSWTYPLDPAVCRDLRRQFGTRLRIGNNLAAWYRAAATAEQQQLELRAATDATLRRVPEMAPVLASAMSNRTYQRVAARFIADGRNVLIADEPGLGKTLEALAAVVETGARSVLVFAKKKAVETVWAPETKRWLGDKAAIYPITGTGPQRHKKLAFWDEEMEADYAAGKTRFMICNIEMVRWAKDADAPKFPELFGQLWDAIIVDESHKALIGKHTMSNSITQTRYGMMKLRTHNDTIRVALSGTPFRGKPDNLWGTLNWLRPDLYTGYWRFAERYFEVDDNGYGKKVGGLRPEMIEEFDRALAPIMLRRTKAEVAPEMPARRYGGTPLDPGNPDATIGVWLEMDSKQARDYQAMSSRAMARLEGGLVAANGVLPEMTRLKQFAVCGWKVEEDDVKPAYRGAKYDWLKEFLEERAENGTKVVVASQYTKVVNAFADWLAADGIASYVLTGETTDRQATERVAAFNDPSDPVPVFLINTLAGGESINLDNCSDDVVFLDETFIPDDQEQVENRIHRMSRIHQVTVWYLRSKGTIEETVCRVTGAREAVLKGRLDGSRGVSYRRLLAG